MLCGSRTSWNHHLMACGFVFTSTLAGSGTQLHNLKRQPHRGHACPALVRERSCAVVMLSSSTIGRCNGAWGAAPGMRKRRHTMPRRRELSMPQVVKTPVAGFGSSKFSGKAQSRRRSSVPLHTTCMRTVGMQHWNPWLHSSTACNMIPCTIIE